MREREEIYKMRETKGKKKQEKDRQADMYTIMHTHACARSKQTDRQRQSGEDR